MRIYLKYIFSLTFVFTGLYFILVYQSYLKGKVLQMNGLVQGYARQVNIPLSTLKSKEASNMSPMKKKQEGKVLGSKKPVSKMKTAPKTQKKIPMTTFPKKKKMTSFPVKMKISPQVKNMALLPVTKSPQIMNMTSLTVTKSSQIRNIVSLPVTKSPQIRNMSILHVKKNSQIKELTPPSVIRSPKIKNISSRPVANFLQMKIPLSLELNGSLLDNRTLLAVLATTWLPEKQKVNVHENVARVWGSWPGIVQPVVYTDLSMTDKSFSQCVTSGWKFSPILKTNCAGIPVLKTMVTNLLKNFPNSDFYGFVNSDILFDPGLIETFKFVKKHIKNRPVMLIGQRTNVDMINSKKTHSPKEVISLAKNGKLMRAYAIDYFLTDGLFPWDKFPDLVIGRHQYDNYLVYFSLMQRALLIDVTQTVKAVHQTTEDGNNSGNHRHHKNCNRIMIKTLNKSFSSSWGFVTCARKYTHRNKSGSIVMSDRKPWRHCHP